MVRNRSDRRSPPVVGLVGGLVAVLAWVAIATRRVPMPGSMTGVNVAAPGVPEAMALSNGLVGVALYLVMWGVMMVAMMYPSALPTFRRVYHERSRSGSTDSGIATVAFVATFTMTWTLTGVVPLLVNVLVPIESLAVDHATELLGAALLVVGGFQLTRLKYRHLEHCRRPIEHQHDPDGRVAGAIRSGLAFAVDSIGCCWALMGLMVVVGSMNVLWMAGITLVLTAEILAPWGIGFSRAFGVASGVIGAGLLLGPLLWPGS